MRFYLLLRIEVRFIYFSPDEIEREGFIPSFVSMLTCSFFLDRCQKIHARMGWFVSQIWPLKCFWFFFPDGRIYPPILPSGGGVCFGIPEFCVAYEMKKKKILLVESCSAKSCCCCCY